MKVITRAVCLPAIAGPWGSAEFRGMVIGRFHIGLPMLRTNRKGTWLRK